MRDPAAPPVPSDPWDIAKRHFYMVMDAEDQNLGCEVVRATEPLNVAFCCQWNKRELCGECRSLEHRIEEYAVRCIDEARSASEAKWKADALEQQDAILDLTAQLAALRESHEAQGQERERLIDGLYAMGKTIQQLISEHNAVIYAAQQAKGTGHA